ncbi:MAG TPA: LamG domain-containing protein, partial [Roseiflexaceae bacterium]|nr:LamG domain-containing protein [Roseiflexaceae bacterium]
NGDYGDYGISLYGGRIAFGVHNGSTSNTLCGSTHVADNAWHHIAVTRRLSDGRLQIFVDGTLDGTLDGPNGSISYRVGRATSYPNSDPYLVLGAEKHDFGTNYPSYRGLFDELRLSNTLRYSDTFTRPTEPFIADSATVGLYHFDEGSGTIATDSATAAGSPVNGTIRYGGASNGPTWETDTPWEVGPSATP